jgi:purine catabolism regulator
MARLDSIARLVGGRLLGTGIPLDAPVDRALTVADLQVIGHPDFVPLVVVEQAELAAVMGESGALLRQAVVVLGTTVDAAARLAELHGITVLTVPGTRADVLLPTLVGLLHAEQAANDRLVTTGTKVLTQVARTGGIGAVLAELAVRLDGWAVLLDSHGQPITSAGAGALHLRDATAVALRRPVRVRHPGLDVYPVGSGEDLSAYLVIASRSGARSRTRDLASQAAALLDLLLRTHDHSVAERLGRSVLFTALLEGAVETPAALLRRWGVREQELVAIVVASRIKSVEVERLVTRWFDDIGWPHLLTGDRDRVVALVRTDRSGDIESRVREFSAGAGVALRCGIGSPARLDALARSVAEAREAYDVAVRQGDAVVRYEALPTVRYVLDRLDPDARARVTGILDGLRGANGRHGALTRTLHTYLSENGSWTATARRLGIHRQTLVARIERIHELTALSMANPDDRAAAWLAVRALPLDPDADLPSPSPEWTA